MMNVQAVFCVCSPLLHVSEAVSLMWCATYKVIRLIQSTYSIVFTAFASLLGVHLYEDTRIVYVYSWVSENEDSTCHCLHIGALITHWVALMLVFFSVDT